MINRKQFGILIVIALFVFLLNGYVLSEEKSKKEIGPGNLHILAHQIWTWCTEKDNPNADPIPEFSFVTEGKWRGNFNYWDPINFYIEGECRNGMAIGVWEFYHENGKKALEARFEKGFPEGQWVYWFDNGQKQRIEGYENKMPTRNDINWYRNGIKKKESSFERGKKNGLTEIKKGYVREWDENGTLVKEEVWREGKKILPEE